MLGNNSLASSTPTKPGGLFGNAAATTTPAFGSNTSGFGAPATSLAAPTLGGICTNTSKSATALPTLSGFGGFGSTFGKPATTTVTPGFGGFGGTTNFMLGQPQQIKTQETSPDEAFAQSIFNVSILGDERDTIIAKWNYLQAMWGTGKSFYSQIAAPVEITPQNFFCRLKAMGYCRIPGFENEFGLVRLLFNKPIADLKAQKPQILTALNSIFGNKPYLTINIESEKEHEEKKSRIAIYVEKSQFAPTETKRIPATEVVAYLNQMNLKSQLDNIGVYEVIPLTLPDKDQLRAYLENPPKGIDPRMWHHAKIDNPDPGKFLPVPMIGFTDLKQRNKCQEKEAEMQALFLKKLEKDLTELRQKRVAAATSQIKEHKRQLAELSHKILKIIVKQECFRKVGLSLTPEEEAFRTKLENMQALVSAPNHFKGRLSELLSQMRMQRNQYIPTTGTEYTIDKDCEDEMKQFLAMQQKAMEVLTETVKKDMRALQIIIDGMLKLIQT